MEKQYIKETKTKKKKGIIQELKHTKIITEPKTCLSH